MAKKPKQFPARDGAVPLITIPLPRDVVSGMKGRHDHYDAAHQLAEAELGDLIHGKYVGVCASAAASGEAMENYTGVIFSQGLPNKPSWCLHAAKMGNGIIIRAGYLAGLTDEEPVSEQFPDEIEWIFKENCNETWLQVFKDEIRETVEVKHRGTLLCRVRFTRQRGSGI